MSAVPPSMPLLPFSSAQPVEHQYIRPGGVQPKGFAYNLTFEVGVSYLAGIATGGSYGFISGLHKVSTSQSNFTGRLKLNQILNSSAKAGSQTANGFAVFALTYSLTRDIVKFQLRSSPVDDPSNEAIGAAVAGTIQGLTRFPRGPAIGCGVALGGITYLAMKYGMDSIKKLPFEKL